MQIVLTEHDLKEAVIAHAAKLVSNKYTEEVEIVLPETALTTIVMTNGPGGPAIADTPAPKKKAATKKAPKPAAKPASTKVANLPADEPGDDILPPDEQPEVSEKAKAEDDAADAEDSPEVDAVTREMEGKDPIDPTKKAPTKKRMFGQTSTG